MGLIPNRGNNCIIGDDVTLGENVILGHNCIIEDHVTIGDNAYIDSNTILRSGTRIGDDAFIGSNCIIGEYLNDFYREHLPQEHKLSIGRRALIRSGSIIYTGSDIGDDFQTGHQVTIREKSRIGSHVSIGTLSDIQGNCKIGDYVRLHSNVHIGQLSVIDSFVWIYPYVVLTNDPTPPSSHFKGVHVHAFAIVATSSTIMPGLEIESDSLVAAGAIVTKDVSANTVVGGTPAKVIGDVRKIKNHYDGEPAYPWREHFDTYMPWHDIGYDKWYAGLTDDEKAGFGIA